VVELDGEEHHTDESAVTDSARDSLLSRGKLDVFRLSWTDLNSKLGIDKLRTSLSVGSEIVSAIDRDGLREVLFAPTTVHRVCFGIVEGVVRGFLKAGEPWFIEINDSIGITMTTLRHLTIFGARGSFQRKYRLTGNSGREWTEISYALVYEPNLMTSTLGSLLT
jgi:hypothetical protein